MRRLPLFLLFLGCGCSSAPGSDSTPILERAAGSMTCRTVRKATSHSPRFFGREGHALASTRAGVAFLARAEGARKDAWDPPELALVVSSLGVDETFGPTSSPAPVKTGPVALAPRGEGLALVFFDASQLRFTGLDASGKPTLAPGPGLAAADEQSRPQLVAGPAGGFGLVFTDAGSAGRRVRFVALDADGKPLAEPRTLHEESSWANPAPSLTAGPEGYAVLWSSSSGSPGVYFERLDAKGAELVAARRISRDQEGYVSGGAIGFAQATTTLVAAGDGFVAAWPEAHEAEKGASSAIRVVRLDEAGEASESPVELRRRTDDIDEVEPMLVPFGSDVALFWGRGTHIYQCGGCVPDTSVEVVVLDPRSLDPKSSVAKVAIEDRGGLLRRQVAVLGSTLLTTFEITFHTSADPGSAVFACE